MLDQVVGAFQTQPNLTRGHFYLYNLVIFGLNFYCIPTSLEKKRKRIVSHYVIIYICSNASQSSNLYIFKARVKTNNLCQ